MAALKHLVHKGYVFCSVIFVIVVDCALCFLRLREGFLTAGETIPKFTLRARLPYSKLLAQALPGNMCYGHKSAGYERPSSYRSRLVTRAAWVRRQFGYEGRMVTKAAWLQFYTSAQRKEIKNAYCEHGFLTEGCWPRRCQATCSIDNGRIGYEGHLVTKAVWLPKLSGYKRHLENTKDKRLD